MNYAKIKYNTVSRHTKAGTDKPDVPGKKIEVYRKSLKKSKLVFTEKPFKDSIIFTWK